jgi:hypothetical protein
VEGIEASDGEEVFLRGSPRNIGDSQNAGKHLTCGSVQNIDRESNRIGGFSKNTKAGLWIDLVPD